MTILLIESDTKTAMEVKKLIEKMGHTLGKIAKNYQDALMALDELVPNLIIADLELNGTMDGLAAVQDIQDDYQIPVIFYSRLYSKEIVERIKKLNVINYIIKNQSFRLDEMQIAIELAHSKIKNLS
jgi:CheY-like chemotaxis protein